MIEYIKTHREDLFFEPIARHLFSTNANGRPIDVPAFKAILHKEDCLGVRQMPSGAEECQYYEHEFAYESAALIAQEIDPMISSTISYKTSDANEALIFFFRDIRTGENVAPIEGMEAVSVKKDKKRIEFFPIKNNPQLEENELKFQKSLVHLLDSGFRPTIAVKNEYTYGGRTIFYLLVEPKDNQGYTRTYLTIAKYTFEENTIAHMSIEKREKVQLFGDGAALNSCVPHFKNAIQNFSNTIKELQKIEATPEQLVAVALDIFNTNRSTQALLSDSRLHKKTHKFIDNARGFFQNQNSMSHLVSFIVRYHYFDFYERTTDEYKFKEVMTEKRAFSNLKRLFTEKNKERGELRSMAQQVSIFEEVESGT